MLFSRNVRVGAIVAALAVAGWLLAQSQPPSKQHVVLLKRGPAWVAGKPAEEQALGNHGRYLQEQMTKGALQLAGLFLDDSGGLILYNARDEAEVRAIAEHDCPKITRESAKTGPRFTDSQLCASIERNTRELSGSTFVSACSCGSVVSITET